MREEEFFVRENEDKKFPKFRVSIQLGFITALVVENASQKKKEKRSRSTRDEFCDDSNFLSFALVERFFDEQHPFFVFFSSRTRMDASKEYYYY